MKLALAARPALAKLIRLLASDVDGEVLGAAHALGRALKANGCDFHDLASIVEAPPIVPNGGGRAGSGFHDHFGDDDGDPAETWEAMVDACADQRSALARRYHDLVALLTPKERQFIEALQHWYGEPTQKQLDWLVALFARVRRAA